MMLSMYLVRDGQIGLHINAARGNLLLISYSVGLETRIDVLDECSKLAPERARLSVLIRLACCCSGSTVRFVLILVNLLVIFIVNLR